MNTCEECGGEGGFDCQACAANGCQDCDWNGCFVCKACNGTGDIEDD